MLLASLYERLEDTGKAQRQYQAVISANPNYLPGREAYIRSLMTAGGGFTSAGFSALWAMTGKSTYLSTLTINTKSTGRESVSLHGCGENRHHCTSGGFPSKSSRLSLSQRTDGIVPPVIARGR